MTAADIDRAAALRLTARRWDPLAAGAPVALVIGFFAIYLAAPQFYLRYILEFRQRETQAVELITIGCAAVAAAILIVRGLLEWRDVARAPGGSKFPGGAVLIVLMGLAALFFAGEESSWGQIYFKWRTPTELKSVSRETNLHNGRLSSLVHFAGDAFVIGTFIALPIAWRFRDRLRLPRDWRVGVAEWPVLATASLAMVMRTPKQYWMATHTDDQLHASVFYVQYLEQIGEQKEMLVAVAMLIYAIYRVAAIRAERRLRSAE